MVPSLKTVFYSLWPYFVQRRAACVYLFYPCIMKSKHGCLSWGFWSISKSESHSCRVRYKANIFFPVGNCAAALFWLDEVLNMWRIRSPKQQLKPCLRMIRKTRNKGQTQLALPQRNREIKENMHVLADSSMRIPLLFMSIKCEAAARKQLVYLSLS